MIVKSKNWVSRGAVVLGVGSALIYSGCGSSGGSNNANSSSAAASVCRGAVRAEMKDEGTFVENTASPSSASESGLSRLHGHVPSAVKAATDLGKSADTQEFPVTLALELNHEKELGQRLNDIYTPGSPSFHQYLKPEEFRAQFGPTPDQISQVSDYLQKNGFHSVTAGADGYFVHATGSAKTLNDSFHTEIHQYIGKTGQPFRSPAYELQVPKGLPVRAVHGLENLTRMHPHLKGPSTSTGPRSGTGPSGGFSPVDIRTAYHVPTSLDGSGQTLAVFELDGYTASDITGFETNFGIPSIPLQNVLVDSATGTPGGAVAEVTLDIELMAAIAPGAAKIMVYEGPNSDQGMLDTYAKIASDNIAKSISTSWGQSEGGVTSSFIQSENTIFMQMAAQGQTIYSAAGDAGAYDNGSTLSVDDPSGQPYVVGVGGTTLSTSGGVYASETTWNDSGGAGGGGISTVWSQPAWQTGAVTAAGKGSLTMRNIPDVALHADINTGYSIYVNGGWSVWGGTSCAAPLWAGFNALVNQKRAENGLPTLGFANPAFYSIGQSTRYAADFNDIRDGSTNLFYPAVAGYDNATGWGSFNGTNLLEDLAAEPQSTGGNPLPPPAGSSCL